RLPRVAGGGTAGLPAPHRRDDHDAAPTALNHPVENELRHAGADDDVACKCGFEFFRAGVAPRAARPRAEVVDEDVDWSEVFLRVLHGSYATALGCDVGGNSEPLDLCGDSLYVGFGPSDDRYARAFAGQRLRDAEADALRRGCDQRDLALHVEFHASRILDRCRRPLR